MTLYKRLVPWLALCDPNVFYLTFLTYGKSHSLLTVFPDLADPGRLGEVTWLESLLEALLNFSR